PAGHAGGPARHGVYALIAAGLLDAGAPGKPAIAGRPARRVPYRGRDPAARLPRETPGGEPVEAECVEVRGVARRRGPDADRVASYWIPASQPVPDVPPRYSAAATPAASPARPPANPRR